MGHLKGLHVEDLLALELSEELETLETGGLLLVGGHLTVLAALALDDGRAGGEAERGRGEETRGGGDRGGGDAERGGSAGDETAGGEEHGDDDRPVGM